MFPQFGRLDDVAYVPERIRTVARDIRQISGQGRSIPFDPHKCCADLGIALSMIDLPEGLSGRMRLTADGPQIEIRKTDGPLRKRFTICHEIAHLCFIEEKPSLYRELGQAHHCDATDQREERYCDRIAEELLMPRGPFSRVVRKHGSTRSAVVTVARHFDVSIKAVLTRAKGLGLWSVYQQRWLLQTSSFENANERVCPARYALRRGIRSSIEKRRTIERMRLAMNAASTLFGRAYEASRLLPAQLETHQYMKVETRFGDVHLAHWPGASYIDAYVVE